MSEPRTAHGAAVGDPMLPRVFSVSARRQDTIDTFTLELSADDGGDFVFQPGQFNMLYGFGRGESAISISGDPAVPARLVHTVRAVGTVTQALEALEPGARLGVRGPFGSAWPVAAARGRDVVFVAGGIGLAPLRPAILAVLAARAEFGRIVLLYGARTPADILYREELERLRARLDVEVRVTVDTAAADWHGDVGVVTRLVPRADFDPRKALAMVCGPEIMLRYSALELLQAGMSPADVHVTLERNMKCAIAFCGHCQYGPELLCRDGPVYPWTRVSRWFDAREL